MEIFTKYVFMCCDLKIHIMKNDRKESLKVEMFVSQPHHPLVKTTATTPKLFDFVSLDLEFPNSK